MRLLAFIRVRLLGVDVPAPILNMLPPADGLKPGLPPGLNAGALKVGTPGAAKLLLPKLGAGAGEVAPNAGGWVEETALKLNPPAGLGASAAPNAKTSFAGAAPLPPKTNAPEPVLDGAGAPKVNELEACVVAAPNGVGLLPNPAKLGELVFVGKEPAVVVTVDPPNMLTLGAAANPVPFVAAGANPVLVPLGAPNPAPPAPSNGNAKGGAEVFGTAPKVEPKPPAAAVLI